MAAGGGVIELKQVLGALIFGANRPLSIKEMRKCLVEVAAERGGETTAFAKVREKDIIDALAELRAESENVKGGFVLTEVAGGYKFQTDATCGKWLRHFLDAGKPHRLSRPALETLAIIAYRQPVTRAEIEGVRGVNVDHIVRTLMEMQLIRIVGRSELPGRPFQYGTTHSFLEHFGLKGLSDLEQMGPMQLAARAEGSAFAKASSDKQRSGVRGQKPDVRDEGQDDLSDEGEKDEEPEEADNESG